MNTSAKTVFARADSASAGSASTFLFLCVKRPIPFKFQPQSLYASRWYSQSHNRLLVRIRALGAHFADWRGAEQTFVLQQIAARVQSGGRPPIRSGHKVTP